VNRQYILGNTTNIKVLEVIMPRCSVCRCKVDYENAFICDSCHSYICGECIIRYGKGCDCGGKLHHL